MSIPALRNSTSSDAPFIYALNEQTLRPHLEALGKRWSLAKMQQKCEQDAIDPHCKIVQAQGQDCGVFCVETCPSEMWLHALLLRPEWQRKGIGSSLMLQALGQARQLALPMRLHIVRGNTAIAFYEKLGFKIYAQDEVHLSMHRAATG